MMKHNQTIQHPEDSFAFMRGLTFIGGFLNAYSYFTRGGVFVTFHTGNLVRVGLSIVEKDVIQLWNSFIPIISAFLGAVMAILLKNKITDEGDFHKKIILTEILSLFIIGFLWSDPLDRIVNFILSFIAMFQLSSFRKIKDKVHNTTIMTGNLRTTAQFLAGMLINRDRKSVIEFITYLFTFLSFLIGVVVGGISSLLVGNFAIWICVFILLVLYFNLNKRYERQNF